MRPPDHIERDTEYRKVPEPPEKLSFITRPGDEKNYVDNHHDYFSNAEARQHAPSHGLYLRRRCLAHRREKADHAYQ